MSQTTWKTLYKEVYSGALISMISNITITKILITIKTDYLYPTYIQTYPFP